MSMRQKQHGYGTAGLIVVMTIVAVVGLFSYLKIQIIKYENRPNNRASNQQQNYRADFFEPIEEVELSLTELKKKLSCEAELVTEADLANCLKPEAKEFYLRSMEIRSDYPAHSGYKDMLAYLNHPTVVYFDEEAYFHNRPGNKHIPNPSFYGKIPEDTPGLFYRYVKDCDTKETILRAVIDTSLGYRNYVGGDRYQQQCVYDGSADTYYVEGLTKLE